MATESRHSPPSPFFKQLVTGELHQNVTRDSVGVLFLKAVTSYSGGLLEKCILIDSSHDESLE